MASVAHAGARFIAATRTVSVRNGAIQRRAGSIPDTTLTATRTVSVRNGAIQRRDWRRAEHQTVNRGDARADACRVLEAEIAVRLRLGDLAVTQGWITHDDLAIALAS